MVPWVIATGLAITVAVLSVLYAPRPSGEERLTMLSLLPPEGGAFTSGMPPAVSPDGRQIAFVADGRRSVWIRELDSPTARELPGSEVASVPFWKPDGQFLAFIAGGRLKRIDRSGSAPALSLADADPLSGGSWSKDDVILFGTGTGGLFRIPAAGGTITQVTRLDRTQSEIRHGFPWFLPDGRHFLYTAISTDPSKTAIYIGELDSNARRRVASAGTNGVYVKPGYLLYVQEGTLLAQPFDAAKQVTTADAVPIAEDIDYSGGGGQPRYAFSASEMGMLAYKSSRSQENWQLTLYDRSGKLLGTIGDPARIQYAVFSPDGRTVAFSREDPRKASSADIWLHDMVRGGERRLTTNDGFNNGTPVWSPDGHFIAFPAGHQKSPGLSLIRQAIDGTSREELLTTEVGVPTDWSRDGRYILADRNGDRTGKDLWVVPLSEGGKPYPYLETPFSERRAKISPDGKWVAYVSDDTSRNEIYVDSFPQRSGKQQVSIHGGDRPVWGRSGNELFFIGADQTMMAADIRDRGDRLDVGVPKSLFQVRVSMGLGSDRSGFDVSDDDRFLIPTLVNSGSAVPLTLVVNWPTLIRK
jgi:Tol biopolymer transport system component